MPDLAPILAPFQPALQVLAEHAVAQQSAVWVVGGTLRDALVGRPIKDVDLAVAGDATELARTVADALGAAFVPLDDERAVARVVLADGAVLDFARLRAPTLDQDLQARDFTANALAAPLLPDGRVGPLIDSVGGAADIAAGVLRLCSPASFADDPLRILRATRLASQLGWTLDHALDVALRAAAPQIATISAERVRDELLALLATSWSAPWLRYLDRAGVLAVLLPELGPTHGETQPIIHFLDVWEHTLEAICCGEWILAQLADVDPSLPPAPPADRADPYPPAFFNHPVSARIYPDMRADLQWAAPVLAHMRRPLSAQQSHIALWKLALLLHDIAKPATRVDKPEGGVSFYGHQDIGADMARAIGQRLRLSRAEVDYIATVVRGHMRPGQLNDLGEITPRAAYRFFRDLEPAAVDTLLHSLADHLATRGPQLSPPHWAMHLAWTDAMLGFHWDPAREQQKRAPLVDGHTLMRELNLAAGPQVGELLEAIREAHAAGEISSGAEALALARRLQA